MKIKTVDQVAAWRLCIGCGVCAYACPEQNITLIDIVDEGIRPTIDPAKCKQCGDCVKVCPGYQTLIDTAEDAGTIKELIEGWGPVLEVWEGYASDNEIRFQGSSGGLASALALYCIEKDGMHGVLHAGADKANPLSNKTALSRNRADILARTGSRYSPASPCDSLALIESAPRPCAFIGKPCDVAGLRRAQTLRPALDEKVDVAIGIFCAGTPSRRGTLELLETMQIDPQYVAELRYRGKGWPGAFAVRTLNDEGATKTLTYKESWGFIQEYRPYRCYLCPDGTSEFADISCGDPWYREVGENEAGYSLAIARTERGRQILHAAMDAGYVVLEQVDPAIIGKSQGNLLVKRGAIWGRLFAMRGFGIPVPQLKGFSLFSNWLKIPLTEKARSILGTARRIVQRTYYRRKA